MGVQSCICSFWMILFFPSFIISEVDSSLLALVSVATLLGYGVGKIASTNLGMPLDDLVRNYKEISFGLGLGKGKEIT